MAAIEKLIQLQAICAEHDYYYCQRSAMVAFQKEAGSVSQSEKLPPTQAALGQTAMRANYQA